MEQKEINFEYIQNTQEMYSIKRSSILNTIILNLSQRISITLNKQKLLLMPYSMCIVAVNASIEMELNPGAELLLISFDRLGTYYENKLCTYLQNIPEEELLFSSHSMSDKLKSFSCSMIDTYVIHLENERLKDVKFNELLFILFDDDIFPRIASYLKTVMYVGESKFKTLVNENYTPVISVKSLAHNCGYTLAHFEDLFKKEFNMTPKDWLRVQTGDLIKNKLSDPDYSLQQISILMGMSSPQQFTRFCKKTFGKCPSKLREI